MSASQESTSQDGLSSSLSAPTSTDIGLRYRRGFSFRLRREITKQHNKLRGRVASNSRNESNVSEGQMVPLNGTSEGEAMALVSPDDGIFELNTQPCCSESTEIIDVGDRKRRRVPLLCNHLDIAPLCLDDFPEYTCSICLDVLTHPVSLKRCTHVFCRLCIFEMIQSCLKFGNMNPSCPLCRKEIEKMSDVVKEKSLAEQIYKRFPSEVVSKVSATHSLTKQREVAMNIKLLANLILEAADSEERSSVTSSEDVDDEDFLLLTIELVCLVYSVFIFLFLLWLRMSNYFL